MIRGVLSTCTAYSKLAIHFVAGEIAGNSANKEVAPRGIKAKFGSNSRVGATEDRGKWILAGAQRLAFMRKVMPERGPADIAAAALRQTVERGVRRHDILRLRRRVILRGQCGATHRASRQC